MKINSKKIYDKTKKIIKENYKDIIFLIIIILIAFVKLPYVVYKPGGAISLSDRIEVDNNYKNKGDYNLNYVSVSEGNIPTLILSFFVKDWDIVKKSKITYTDTDYETTFKIEQIDYENSIALATLNAIKKADLEYKINSQKGIVIYVNEKAKTNLKQLDEIISINGNKYTTLSELKEYLNTLKDDDKVKIKVKNNNKEYERYAYIYEYENQKIIGVNLITELDYETSPKVVVKSRPSEAGSSGGLMLTLAIYDALIEKDLTHGLNIMGTGTIDENNNVGEIGGIKYKLLGAQKEKADIFFVPKENYKEAKKVYDEYKLDFKLVKVNTLDDAINYLENINE